MLSEEELTARREKSRSDKMKEYRRRKRLEENNKQKNRTYAKVCRQARFGNGHNHSTQ